MVGSTDASFSDSLEEKFVKPLLRMVVGCLDIMMPRVKGRTVTMDVKTPKYNFDEAVAAIKSRSLFYLHQENLCEGEEQPPPVYRVKWDLLERMLLQAIDTKYDDVRAEVQAERRYFEAEEASVMAQYKLKHLKKQVQDLPVVQGKWNRVPMKEREYHRIDNYVVSESVEKQDHDAVHALLQTNLPTAYLGQAYNFDDGALTEEWMCTYEDKTSDDKDGIADGPKKPSRLKDHEIIRALTNATLESMCEQVRDRVCTDLGVLSKTPLNLQLPSSSSSPGAVATPLCVEQAVLGIDCATRKLIEVTLTEKLGVDICSSSALKTFIERYLLPQINRADERDAHSMQTVMKDLVVFLSPTPEEHDNDKAGLMRLLSSTFLEIVQELGDDTFRIHSKGTGVVCTSPAGISPHVVVCEYLGELYPPYRWCERQDVVEQAQRKFELKPTLPDFYNILLERPRHDERGYGLLFVDASDKANMGSTLAHSCDNNCTSAVVSRNGKLCIVLTTNRYIYPGEELTHDYAAVTSSEEEWRSAVCLCGMTKCRGSFLHFATQDDLQQILNQHCSPLWRYASLLKSCSGRALSKEDGDVLDRHGMLDLGLGQLKTSCADESTIPTWARKYAADILRFIEYERQALPCAMMRQTSTQEAIKGVRQPSSPSKQFTSSTEEAIDNHSSMRNDQANRRNHDFETTFSAADIDARCVMEQRVQSLCCALSMTHNFLQRQPSSQKNTSQKNQAPTMAGSKGSRQTPLELLGPAEAGAFFLRCVEEIPSLLRTHALEPAMAAGKISKKSKSKSKVQGDTKISSSSYSPVDKKAKESKSCVADDSKHMEALDSSPTREWAKEKKRKVEKNASEGSEKDKENGLSGNSPSTMAHSSLSEQGLADAHLEAEKRKYQKRVVEALETAIRDISSLITVFTFKASAASATTEFIGLSAIHKLILEVREIIISVQEYGTRTARLRLLGDVLGLMGHTYNLSRPVKCVAIESAPIAVPSRELGTNVRRKTIAKIYQSDHGTSLTGHGLIDVATYRSIDLNGDRKKRVNGAGTTSSAAQNPSEMIPPAELVYAGMKQYSSYFAFEQMMQWFVAGEGGENTRLEAERAKCASVGKDKESTLGSTGSSIGKRKKKPTSTIKKEVEERESDGTVMNGLHTFDHELYGCAQVPRPWQCFGECDAQYSDKQRNIFLDILRNERVQSRPWPSSLRACFRLKRGIGAQYGRTEGETQEEIAVESQNDHLIFGSPMLDASLGQTQAVREVLFHISPKDAAASTRIRSSDDVEHAAQLDDRLAPESNSQWIQCDKCHKWRRLPWHVDVDALDDDWTCEKNSWDLEKATCDAPADEWDPDREDIAAIDNGQEAGVIQDMTVGDWRDVYCNRNHVYYEGCVQKVRDRTAGNEEGCTKPEGADTPMKEYLIHYKGFKKNSDEWIAADSDRFQPHNMFTSVTARTIYEQQAYQGMHGTSKREKEKKKKEKDALRRSTALLAAATKRTKKRLTNGSDCTSHAAKKTKKAHNATVSEKNGEGSESASLTQAAAIAIAATPHHPTEDEIDAELDALLEETDSEAGY